MCYRPIQLLMSQPPPPTLSIELPPVPDEIAKLLIVGSNNDHNSEKRLHETKLLLAEIHKLVEAVRQKCEAAPTNPPVIETPKHAAHHLIWAQTKLVKLEKRRQVLSRNIYTKVFNIMTLTEYFIERALGSNIPVFMDMEGLKPMIHGMFAENPDWATVKSKIARLTAYVAAHKDDIQFTVPSVDLCAASLEQCANRCDSSRGFAYYAHFDHCLLDYLWYHGIEAVDRVAQAMSPMVEMPSPLPRQMNKSSSSSAMRKKSKETGRGSMLLVSPTTRANMRVRKNCVRASNVESLIEMYESLEKLFRADTVEKEIVLGCALIRIVFDRMYVIDPMLQTGNNGIQQGLDIVRRLKVTDMDVPAGVFENEDVEIRDLCAKNTVIREVLEFADSLNFCGNPFDIAETVYTVSNTINGLQKLSEPNMEICFDDFFSVFVVLFCASPPANSCGIAMLLDAHSYLELPTPLKHAATSFCAWVGYLRSFPTQEHSPEMQAKVNAALEQLTRNESQ